MMRYKAKTPYVNDNTMAQAINASPALMIDGVDVSVVLEIQVVWFYQKSSSTRVSTRGPFDSIN